MLSNYFLNGFVIQCEDTKEVCTGYNNYLNSKHWHNLREKYITADTVCEKCKKKGILQLHHLSYKRLGKEQRKDFAILCPYCHKKAHELKDKKKENALVLQQSKKKHKKKKNKKNTSYYESVDFINPKTEIKRAYKKQFYLKCKHCISERGIMHCDLGYKYCPFQKCGDCKT